MEIGQLRDIDVHLRTIFPATGLDKPLVICSDNHDVLRYAVKAPLWFRADPTFRGLLMILREPRGRVFIGDRPAEIVRVQQNPTKYVRSVSFGRGSKAPTGEQWFTGSIPLNSGLVAIIGNKGSGKSALADTLGLLGATKKSDSFSFLSKERFRHPGSGLAHYFTATIEWESNEKFTRGLDESVKPEELERLKYLPQDHVEKVCNEIVGTGEEGFERELKSVIFSHVPEARRLGHSTLDDLVRFQAGEKQKRIDSLLRQLRETSRSRAVLEAQADPAVKRELEEKIKRRQVELDALDKTKPDPKPDPAAAEGTVTPDEVTLASLREAETRKKVLDDEIAKAVETLGGAERRRAVSLRLLEKLSNFQKDFDVFKNSLNDDAKEIGLVVDDLVSLSIRVTAGEKIRDEAVLLIASTNQQLDSDEPPGLRSQLTVVERQITELQSKLDAPNRAYRAYLKELAAWEQKRQTVQGTQKDAESLAGLTAALAELDQLPTKIESHRDEQIRCALEIHTEKLSQVAVYRNLYGPVQHFVDSQDGLAKDRLKLEFRAELANEDFAKRLLSHLAQNRKGSFMGIDEGRAKAESLVEAANWDDPSSVRTFLQNVDTALHRDQREAEHAVVQLKEQLPKGTKPEEVFNLLYGLEYLRPRYVLRWEGKDLSMLSPGERGTLLLVFYLFDRPRQHSTHYRSAGGQP